jgi:hypothetical protein
VRIQYELPASVSIVFQHHSSSNHIRNLSQSSIELNLVQIGFYQFFIQTFLRFFSQLRHLLRKPRVDSWSTQNSEQNHIPTCHFRGSFEAPVKPPSPAPSCSSWGRRRPTTLPQISRSFSERWIFTLKRVRWSWVLSMSVGSYLKQIWRTETGAPP